ncbi:MAG: DUF1015 domain-containing protein [Candidatus Methanomethylophilus sp.]|nr:DUF1015 domain-containing protein [Methanomethylophilus sp.]
MVTFLPFSGYRPSLRPGENIEDRVSPPYDVISPEQLKELQAKSNNITNLTLAPDADKHYTHARQTLERMVKDGSLKQDTPSFYLYEQHFTDAGKQYRRLGLVGILKTEDYSAGNIIPHEETFSKVKADRLNLLRDMETHLESIFGIFTSFTPELKKKIDGAARLVYRYIDPQQVEHRYYRIADPDLCGEITAALKDQKMLIADGHHRYETALNYAKENPDCEAKQYVLATLVASNDPGLVVWPTHRLVDAGDIGEKSAISKLEKSLTMKEISTAELETELPQHMLGLMFRTGRCFVADPIAPSDNIMMQLDTYVTQQVILNGVYKADEGKSTVSYDAELGPVKEAMAAKKHDLAVVLNPPSIKTIWDLAGAGKRMPKKTTFFFPKIWSGWVIYRMA